MATLEGRYTDWRQNYLRVSPLGYYCFYNGSGENEDAITCSEAHGYAMLIAVLHNNQQDFDHLLKFFLHFKNERGLMKWQVRQRSSTGEIYVNEDATDNATDGDIDIATALFLAGRRFSDSPMFPTHAYWAEGNQLASAILRYNIHPRLGTPLLGDWANEDDRENQKLYNATRSSDFILSAFLLFHRNVQDPNEQSRWQWVLESTLQAALSLYQQQGYALLPDFLVYEKGIWTAPKGKLLEAARDGDCGWNACRTPWRLAHYYHVSGDQRILPLLQNMHRALRGLNDWPEVPAGLRARDAKPLEKYTDRAFIAPAGYLCWVLQDYDGHLQAVKALTENDPSYFGDSIDVTIAEQASNVQLFQ